MRNIFWGFVITVLFCTNNFSYSMNVDLWQGKIIVSDPVKGDEVLYGFCDKSGLYLSTKKYGKEILCNGVAVSDYKGMTAKIKSKRIEGNYTIYNFLFDDGKELFYNDYASSPDDHAKDLKDLVEGMSYVSLLQDVKRLKKVKGNPVFTNENLFYSGVDLSGSKVKIQLSDGTSHYEKDINHKIIFIDLFIQKNKIEALAILNNVNVHYDDMEDVWLHKPLDLISFMPTIFKLMSPVYPTFRLSKKTKKFYMGALYNKSSWIFFDEILIKTNGKTYRSVGLNPSRTNLSNSVSESELIVMTNKEWLILKSLSEFGGKVRFSGDGQSTHEFTDIEMRYLSNILRLIELMA